ncbi:hypothetical protein L195_g041338, partial [Trifolium pratense]
MDIYHLEKKLVEALNIPLHMQHTLTAKVVENLIENGQWTVPDLITDMAPWLTDEILAITLPRYDVVDRLVWKNTKDGMLSARDAYIYFQSHHLSLGNFDMFARSIWVWLEGKLRCKFDFSSPVDMLLRCLSAVRLLLRDIALAAILHTIHTIWMARNGIKLNNANISLHPALIKINTAILLSAGLSNNSCWPDSIALQVMRDLQ